MSQLAHIDDLKAALRGVDLSAWTAGEAGADTSRLDAALEDALRSAEAEAEGMTGCSFAPLQQRMSVLNGRGRPTLRLEHSPVVDLLDLQLRQGPFGAPTAIPSTAFRLEREIGQVQIAPSHITAFAPVGAGGSIASYTFPIGVGNIVARYRTGFAAVGDNIGATALVDDPFPRVASVTTDASYAYLQLGDTFGLFKSGETIAARGAGFVLKNGVDDSSNWTMVTPIRLRCPIASYLSTAKYVFVFVPAAVSAAVVDLAHAEMLRAKGSKDHGGTGGAVSLSAGPFSEQYGATPYAGVIEALEKNAKWKLGRYKRALVA